MKKVKTANGIILVSTTGLKTVTVVDNSKKKEPEEALKTWLSLTYGGDINNTLVGYFDSPQQIEDAMNALIS